MKKTTILCFALAILIAGCKKVSVEFTYSPTAPRAGQVVSFTNNSSAGEKWAWDFGDNTVSTSKNPNKIYKKPGTYLVTLMVDSAKYNTCSHSIEVYDTVPTFIASTDSICHYTEVTFTANIYNPYFYSLDYEWTLPEECVLVAGGTTTNAVRVYFTEYNCDKTIHLTIKQNGKTYPVEKTWHIYETKAPAIVMETTHREIFRQRIINDRLEDAAPNTLGDNAALLSLTTDTVVVFNGVTFYASQMADIFPAHQVNRVQIDPITRKWYITTPDGLFVSHFDGSQMQLIDADATSAIYVDNVRNLLLWAAPEGLYAMPLVKSKNNTFATEPVLYNQISDIDRIIVNNSLQ